MLAIVSVLMTALTYVPKLIEIGEDVAPFVGEIRTAIGALQSGGQITDDQFAALDAQIKPFEDQLQKLAAEAAASLEPPAPASEPAAEQPPAAEVQPPAAVTSATS